MAYQVFYIKSAGLRVSKRQKNVQDPRYVTQKMSRYVLPQICPLMAFFKQTSRYNTVQGEIHYKTLDKMVQKLKLRYKSPDIKTVFIKLLFCFKNVQIIFEKCPGSRIPGSFLLETLTTTLSKSLVLFTNDFPNLYANFLYSKSVPKTRIYYPDLVGFDACYWSAVQLRRRNLVNSFNY